MEKDTSGDEFGNFLDKLDKRTGIRTNLDSITERYRIFLVERGVDITLSEIDIRSLAARKAMADEMLKMSENQAQLGYLQNLKKRIQAQYLNRDYGAAWQELIDLEFIGEPLDSDKDTEIIIEEFNLSLNMDEELAILHDNTENKMVGYLGEQGLDSISHDEELALCIIIALHNIPSGLEPKDKFERARETLIEYDLLDNPAWASLLDKFFQP